MPLKDGTGPEGKGPMTGRGLGMCKKEKEEVDKKSEKIVKKILGDM